jgi:hypothetical protein
VRMVREVWTSCYSPKRLLRRNEAEGGLSARHSDTSRNPRRTTGMDPGLHRGDILTPVKINAMQQGFTSHRPRNRFSFRFTRSSLLTTHFTETGHRAVPEML